MTTTNETSFATVTEGTVIGTRESRRLFAVRSEYRAACRALDARGLVLQSVNGDRFRVDAPRDPFAGL